MPTKELAVAIPSPLQVIDDDRLARRGVRLYLKRDDLIHPDVPGNKWRKLKYNLQRASDEDRQCLLTFGGAYSNHILATAAAGYYYGFSTIGVIRGEEHLPLNTVLSDAVRFGMRLIYMDRAMYRRKVCPEVETALREQFGDFYLIPEGGSNSLAVRGCAEIPSEIREPFDVICCACGTGGTLAGIAVGLQSGRRAIGFSAVKGGGFLRKDVTRLQEAYSQPTTNWSIETDFHFGGFARRNAELDRFIGDFRDRHGLELDWVYVAKMLYGVFALASAGGFARDTTTTTTTIVAVVTG
ncbi:MAG: 1-aminocyclopropane-1-carboxylate deaminase/D-cysteine desulfhydrase [Pseudonocardiales bacterium]|nr:1-aminocyclopropane-1-carboxylate deaminase/D-cysteine desulfhydrase [Pseudonocardiales bacterium]